MSYKCRNINCKREFDKASHRNQHEKDAHNQAANLLLLKLEIEQICDDVKYAKDAKIAIQKLDFSKATALPPAPEEGQHEN